MDISHIALPETLLSNENFILRPLEQPTHAPTEDEEANDAEVVLDPMELLADRLLTQRAGRASAAHSSPGQPHCTTTPTVPTTEIQRRRERQKQLIAEALRIVVADQKGGKKEKDHE